MTITKFDSLFAGHVDMDNVGYGGIPVNDRRLPDAHLTSVFDKAEAMAKLMDRTGYNTFWMAEHHFQREGYECIPNVLMAALHLGTSRRTSISAAASTSRRCGTRCVSPRTTQRPTS